MKKTWPVLILFCAATAFAEVRPWAAPAEAEKLARELQEFLAGAEVRYPGSPGNLAMEEKINARFAASGLPHGEIKFSAACFIPGATFLSFSNQPPVRIYALHPTLFRPGNFKEKEFSAPLIYLAGGENQDLEKIKGRPLAGALVLMEFDGGTQWLRLLRFGVQGFIFIAPEKYDRNDALSKVYDTEVAAPRFLVNRAAAAPLKTLAAAGGEVRIKAEPSRWENKLLRDLWVFIPGADPDLSREVAVFMAPLDSNCIVPEMAAGAQAGANLFCLTKLLADFQRQAPARSVLLAAVNARVYANQGQRMLAWHMLAKAEAVERLRDRLNGDLRLERTLLDYYGKLRLAGYNQGDEETLLAWRALVDESTGKNIAVKQPLVDLVKSEINRLKNEQMLLYQQNPAPPEIERRKQEIAGKLEDRIRVLMLFNKVGLRTRLRDLTAAQIRILKDYVQEVIRFNALCARLNEADLMRERQNDAVREALQGNKTAFVIALALDWTSPQLGFYAGDDEGWWSRPWSRRWGANTYQLAEELAPPQAGRKNLLADTLTMRGGLKSRYYFSGNDQARSAALFQNANQVAAFDLLNVFPSGQNTFLPSDTFDQLNKVNFAEQTSFLTCYLRALLGAAHITNPSELDPAKIAVGMAPLAAVQLKTYKYDEHSASVMPEMPVPATTILIQDSRDAAGIYGAPLQAGTIGGEVCSKVILLTDQRAAAVFYGLDQPKEYRRVFATAAFHCDPDFSVVDHTIDAGEAQTKMSSDVFSDDRILTLFECREFPIYPVADASLVASTPIYLDDLIALTAKGNTTPRKYGLSGIKCSLSSKAVNVSAGAPAAYYISPGDRVKFITGNKRLALNATADEYEGRGYRLAAEMGPDFFRNVLGDMSILNQARIKKLKDVANELASAFAARGDRCLAAVQAAAAQHDYLQYLQKIYEGVGAQVKSYEQAKQTTDDMLKAIVVYMALLLPFCFFIQKLMFTFKKIEHEMGMFAVLFVLAFVIFRQIHPAFRIAQAAEAIFIAFVMGALGLFVISILRGRFEGEMQLLFRGYLSGIMDEAAYSTVTQKAMLIGVNNMKRRRIRTVLTTMTIVLIAFAMLSFTSISKKVNPTIVHKSSTPSYTGFMFTWPGKSQMEEATFEVMRDLVSPYGRMAERRWKLMPSPDVPFHVAFSNGRETGVDALLGLAVAEDGFLGKLPIVAGRYFSANHAREALISARMAENLNIDPARLDGLAVSCGGYDLKVVGVYDDDKIRNFNDLNGIPILPIKRISQLARAYGQERGGVPEEDIAALGMLFFIDPLSLLIVPSEIARRMGGFAYSISVKLPDDAPVWPLMDLILTATKAKFYMSSLQPFVASGGARQKIAAGAYYIGSNYKTSVGGLAALIVPLFIAATIILNTMLGSVYERKKEIAVYNAIGLNPHHIGLFFLAESFVYGVIGAVGGYLIGQLLSIGINYSGLVQGINFNYSSLSVAYVIVFTVVIVLLSTVYPAMTAVRTAVPSGKRTWSMPAHHGHVMEIVFPFVYQPEIAAGVLAYLREYFARFSEVSIGDLIATQSAHGCRKDERGYEAFRLDYHVALAPYDLGVTEDLKFRLYYDDYVKTYRLALEIKRVSGQDINWVTTNRPFLERLRKYLMRWRNLDLGRQTFYVQQSAAAMTRD